MIFTKEIALCYLVFCAINAIYVILSPRLNSDKLSIVHLLKVLNFVCSGCFGFTNVVLFSTVNGSNKND